MINCPHCIEYVKSNWSYALNAAKKYKIHPVIFLSHSAKETGWGRSFLAVNHKNYFGIMAGGNTNQYWKGKTVKTSSGATWRSYDQPIDSFMDYGLLISSSSLYKDAYKVSSNPDSFAYAISQSPYMTDADGRAKYYNDFVSINKTIASIAVQEKLKMSMSSGFIGLAALILISAVALRKRGNNV